MDNEMTYELSKITDTIKHQDWIWFDDAQPFGCCMCINTRDTFQYLGNTLKTLLDNAVFDGNTYTLTQKMVIRINVNPNRGICAQTPWHAAYTRFSQFAEWGYHILKKVEAIRCRKKIKSNCENKLISGQTASPNFYPMRKPRVKCVLSSLGQVGSHFLGGLGP
jgi:hypothetical protein